MTNSGGMMTKRMLLMMTVALAAACDGRERGEGVPPSSTQEGTIIADTVKQDNTGPQGARTGG